MAPLTTIGIGGAAEWFARASHTADVAAAHAWCAGANVPLFVLGGGSNLVIADRGIPGLVLQMAITGLAVAEEGADTVLRVGAGEPWDGVVAASVSRGLAGLECLSGIPGSAGGTPIQNVGAYGQEVATTIQAVTAFDRTSGRVTTIAAADCGFEYRTSRFKRAEAGRFIICEVMFRLRPGPPGLAYPDVARYLDRAGCSTPTLADVRSAVLAIRRSKGMVIDDADPDTRSVGSFFTNPVVHARVHAGVAASSTDAVPGFAAGGGQVKMPAAWLIERSGFACGFEAGRAGLSTKHPLAIVNRGGATARDVLSLATRIKRRVVERFGIWLTPEPAFIGFVPDDPDVAYLFEKRGG
jgi:UDP-N-acetylmuramate dehydrogenase